jgi:hypothetical protein
MYLSLYLNCISCSPVGIDSLMHIAGDLLLITSFFILRFLTTIKLQQLTTQSGQSFFIFKQRNAFR